ncbi:MAG: hypothetical protein K2H12_07935, partial [Acetatifactor sp.]|nr:hypothetical protein [Acetatifactor sp.]
MLAVLLNWIYIFATTFCLGCGFAALCGKLLKYRIKRIDSLVLVGVIIATVYTQFFSLAGGVGLVANLLLTAVCVITAFLCRRDMG